MDKICGFLLVESQVLSTLSSAPLQRQECGDLCYPSGSAISRAPGNHVHNVVLFFLQWLSNSSSLFGAEWVLSLARPLPAFLQMPAPFPFFLWHQSFSWNHTHPVQKQHFFFKGRRNHDRLEHPSAAVWVNPPKVSQILHSPNQNISEEFYSSFLIVGFYLFWSTGSSSALRKVLGTTLCLFERCRSKGKWANTEKGRINCFLG